MHTLYIYKHWRYVCVKEDWCKVKPFSQGQGLFKDILVPLSVHQCFILLVFICLFENVFILARCTLQFVISGFYKFCFWNWPCGNKQTERSASFLQTMWQGKHSASATDVPCLSPSPCGYNYITQSEDFHLISTISQRTDWLRLSWRTYN